MRTVHRSLPKTLLVTTVIRDVLLTLPLDRRSALQNVAEKVLGDAACAQTLVGDLNVFDPPCLKLAVSKALGFGIIGVNDQIHAKNAPRMPVHNASSHRPLNSGGWRARSWSLTNVQPCAGHRERW